MLQHADTAGACRGECIDGDERCSGWAIQGECAKNPTYMLATCRKSCKSCADDKKTSSS